MNRPGSQRAHWRWSLATRLAAAWAISLGAAVGLSSWAIHRDSGKRLLDGLRQEMGQDAGEIRLKLETWSQTLQEDARSCSGSPLVAEFLRNRNTAEEERWRQLLEDEFRAVFAGKSAYFQMRLLAADGPAEGDELLRLDRKDGKLEVTPRDRLQSKAGRSYFRDAVAMASGEVYLSEINLNRDFGEITEPHIPTIRAAVKIAAQGQGAAMLIINADMRPVFDGVRMLTSPATSVRILDSAGNYLLHPDPSACFAVDLGAGLRPDQEYPELGDAAADGERWLRDGEAGGELALATTIELSKPHVRPITALVSLRESAWYPELMRSRRRAIWSVALAALIGGGIAFLVSLPFTNRLRQLSSALREFDASKVREPLPDAGKDEIGMAVERFREMAIKIREQVASLQDSRDEAEAANASKEEFLAVMSHEIRTPMNAVVGLIRALEANHPPAHQAPILASLRSSSSNLMTLLNTALDYTRLREGVIEFSEEDFDAVRLVREVGQSFKPSAMGKQLELRMDLPQALPVRGDPVRFRQVVNNLVSNAVKFTTKGHVAIALRHEDGLLTCEVSDSGVGIAAHDQDRIFLPFASLQPDGTPPDPGAGLGLAVSKQLVEQQGGQLTLESEAAKGATFTVRLPYPKASGAELPEAASPGAELHRGMRILYVEDVPSNQQVMALTLAESGCQLVCASSGSEAIRILETADGQSFDLALLDLQLPDMAGNELAEILRRSHPQLPLVAVTAQASEATARRCREAGMREVVLKPYSAEALYAAIAAACQPEIAAGLETLHPGNPARSRALATTMARELQAAARELRAIDPQEEWGVAAHRIRRVRHKLTTAVATFQLTRLGTALDQLAESGGHDQSLVTEAVSRLEDAAAGLEVWSTRQPKVQ